MNDAGGKLFTNMHQEVAVTVIIISTKHAYVQQITSLTRKQALTTTLALSFMLMSYVLAKPPNPF